MQVYRKVLLSSLLMACVVSGCSKDFKRSLGISHNSPDEYSVLKNPPLSVPPSFELTPPTEEVVTTQNAVPLVTEEGAVVKETTEVAEATTKDPVVRPVARPVAGPMVKKDPFQQKTQHKSTLTDSDKNFMKRSMTHDKRDDIRIVMEKDTHSTESEGSGKKQKGKEGLLDKIKSWF